MIHFPLWGPFVYFQRNNLLIDLTILQTLRTLIPSRNPISSTMLATSCVFSQALTAVVMRTAIHCDTRRWELDKLACNNCEVFKTKLVIHGVFYMEWFNIGYCQSTSGLRMTMKNKSCIPQLFSRMLCQQKNQRFSWLPTGEKFGSGNTTQ